MSCEKYQAAISEAAAMREVSAMLQRHLNDCASCQARYAEEQELFAAMDASVSRVVNADAGPSFLSRVRAALEQESAVRDESRSWFVVFRPAVALAVGVCLAFAIFERVHPRPETMAQSANVESVASRTAAPEVSQQQTLRPQIRRPTAIPRAASADIGPRQTHEPEVIVPPDERIAFAKFVRGVGQRNQVAIALTQTAPVIPSTFKASEPLEIAELRIEPLSPEEAQ
jgi:hypothetical protein